MTPLVKGIIVCGTDTDVGKTIVSAWLVQGLNATYWKPVQSGLTEGGDTKKIRSILDLDASQYIDEAYKFKAPVSPHWAADQEKKVINAENLRPPFSPGPLIIETSGGLLVPLNHQLMQIEVIKSWGMPVVLVAKSGLGTLNHTFLSLEALRHRNIPILGVILNGPSHINNRETIKEIGKIEVLGELTPMPEVTADSLREQWLKQQLSSTFKRLLKV